MPTGTASHADGRALQAWAESVDVVMPVVEETPRFSHPEKWIYGGTPQGTPHAVVSTGLFEKLIAK